MERREEILSNLKNLEDKHEVRILFAVESGSRLWGMESHNSDYDIRFVYVHHFMHYLSVFSEKKDTIELMVDKSLDLVGWDLKKFLSLASKSNPTSLEWLIADYVYLGSEKQKELQVLISNLNPISLYEHYRSMAFNNWSRYIQNKPEVKIKKYLYVMRGIINALFVINEYKMPPPKLNITISIMSNTIPENVINELRSLIERKRVSGELGMGATIPVLETFIEEFILSHSKHLEITKRKPFIKMGQDEVNKMFHDLLNID